MKTGKIINVPLGMCSVAPMRKEWIAAAIGAGLGLASSIIGGNKAAKAARKAEERQRADEAKEEAWYTRRYNEDYGDTAAGQNLIRKAKDFAKENWRKAAGAQAVGGGTAYATQMAKDAGNKMVGDTIADIAATDQSRKASVDDAHRRAESQFAQQDIQREMGRAQSISEASQGASNAIMQGVSAFEGVNLGGGSNKGVIKPMQSVEPVVGSPVESPTLKGGVMGGLASGATDEQILRAKRLIGG